MAWVDSLLEHRAERRLGAPGALPVFFGIDAAVSMALDRGMQIMWLAVVGSCLQASAMPETNAPFEGDARGFPETPAAGGDPKDSWEWTLESGYLWNVGSNTEIDYEIIPTQLTLRSPVVFTWWRGENGAEIVVRHRCSLLMETITAGPESWYLGVAAAPSIEYWFPDDRTSLFFSIGGGLGWTDSSGGTDGMGQDLTFNWFTQLGIRRGLTETVSLSGGVYFIHHSNLGMTDPNPGIDALGFTIGVAWRY